MPPFNTAESAEKRLNKNVTYQALALMCDSVMLWVNLHSFQNSMVIQSQLKAWLLSLDFTQLSY